MYYLSNLKVGIVGVTNYTGGELLKMLLQHPEVTVSFVYNKCEAGNTVSEVHPDFNTKTDLQFSGKITEDVDVIFLCMPYSEVRLFLAENPINETVRIIDLSQGNTTHTGTSTIINGRLFVYGLPELNRTKIVDAHNVINPSEFSTAVLLSLLPLVCENLVNEEITIKGICGLQQSMELDIYRNVEREIKNSLMRLLPGIENKIHFIWQKGNFKRGISTVTLVKDNTAVNTSKGLFKSYYREHPFVHVLDAKPDLRQVIHTNTCTLAIDKEGDMLLVTAMLDNLQKGAAGQAIQNMNLMFGIEESTGLRSGGEAGDLMEASVYAEELK